MFAAAFSSGVVQNSAKMEEHRIILLFRKPVHRAISATARKLAAPNALFAAILFPLCLWIVFEESELIPEKLAAYIALAVLACSLACLAFFWLYLLPRVYFVASRLLWRQIKRGN